MSGWTPGPWMYSLEEDERGAYCDIHDRNVKLIAHCADETNARLIAAAPEMLDLLKQFVEGDGKWDEWAESARALLARIEGNDDA